MSLTIKGTPTAAATSSVTLPAHEVGDLIRLFVYRNNSATLPSKPAAAGTVPAWVDIDAATGANTNSSRTAYFVATANNHTSGTWTNATGMTATVLNGQATSPIGGHAESGGASANAAQAPAVTLTKTDGTSILLEDYGHRTVTAWSAAPANYTRQVSNATSVCLNTKNSTTTDGAVNQSNTATNSGYRGAAVEILAAPKAATLTDAFGAVDNVKWFYGGGTSVTDGQLVMPADASYSAWALSAVVYDLIASSVFIEFVQPPNVGNGSTEAYFEVRYGTGTENRLLFIWANGSLLAAKVVATTYTQVASATYNSTNHRFLRFREASGTTYWETSADAVTWSTFYSEANPITLTAMYVRPMSGYWGTEPSPGTAIFDNLNLAWPVGKAVTVRQAVGRAANY